MTVATQRARARGAAAAAAQLIAIPEMIGLHWFQYADEPHGGRDDGEDYNFGLVDINDAPYDELVAALADVARSIPRMHGRVASAAARYEPTGLPPAAAESGDR